MCVKLELAAKKMTAATVSQQEDSHRKTARVFRLPARLIETCVFSVMAHCRVGLFCHRPKLSVWNGVRAITVERKILFFFCLSYDFPLIKIYLIHHYDVM